MTDRIAALADFRLLVEMLGRNTFVDSDSIEAVLADAGKSDDELREQVCAWRFANAPGIAEEMDYQRLCDLLAAGASVDAESRDAVLSANWRTEDDLARDIVEAKSKIEVAEKQQ